MFAQSAHHLGFESASKCSNSLANHLRGHLQVWRRENGSPKQQTKPAQRSDPRDVLSSGLYYNLQRDTEQWREEWFRTMKTETWATVKRLVSLSAKTPCLDETMLSERTRLWVSGREKERERFRESTQYNTQNKIAWYSLIESKLNIFSFKILLNIHCMDFRRSYLICLVLQNENDSFWASWEAITSDCLIKVILFDKVT